MIFFLVRFEDQEEIKDVSNYYLLNLPSVFLNQIKYTSIILSLEVQPKSLSYLQSEKKFECFST